MRKQKKKIVYRKNYILYIGAFLSVFLPSRTLGHAGLRRMPYSSFNSCRVTLILSVSLLLSPVWRHTVSSTSSPGL